MSENGSRKAHEARSEPAMTVHCPHCSTGYLLPDHLVGPHGVRVGCPNCRGAFVVLHGRRGADVGLGPTGSVTAVVLADRRAGVPAAVAGADSPAQPAQRCEPAASVPPRTDEAATIAAEVLDAMVGTLGEALLDARLRGTVLSEHGRAIMDAWVEYRRRAAAAPADPFLTALKDRCGIDLVVRPQA